MEEHHPDNQSDVLPATKQAATAQQAVGKSSRQIPTIGRIVHYTLTAVDAAQINRRRTTVLAIGERIRGKGHSWCLNAQAHVGNVAKEGDVLPMLIVRTWDSTPGCAVNGQVFLDGTDVLWVTSTQEGVGPRYYAWPVR